MGISRKISNRLNLGIEHQVNLSDNDALDGIRFRTALDQTNNNDISHYTNLRLGINLGNFNKVTEHSILVKSFGCYYERYCIAKTKTCI